MAKRKKPSRNSHVVQMAQARMDGALEGVVRKTLRYIRFKGEGDFRNACQEAKELLAAIEAHECVVQGRPEPPTESD